MSCEDNPIGALQELSQAQGGRPTPFYELQAVSGESHCPQFTYEARWEELKAVGEGSSKVILFLYSQFINIKHIPVCRALKDQPVLGMGSSGAVKIDKYLE